MKKVIVSAAIITLSGCTSFTREIVHELPVELKQGCYVKESSITGNYVDGATQKDAAFCTQELPPGFKYSFDNGRTKVQVGD